MYTRGRYKYYVCMCTLLFITAIVAINLQFNYIFFVQAIISWQVLAFRPPLFHQRSPVFLLPRLQKDPVAFLSTVSDEMGNPRRICFFKFVLRAK